MTRKFIWAFALVPLFALQTSAASAMPNQVAGLVVDSDTGPIFVPDGQPIFEPEPKAVQAMKIAKYRRHLAALKRRGNLH